MPGAEGAPLDGGRGPLVERFVAVVGYEEEGVMRRD